MLEKKREHQSVGIYKGPGDVEGVMPQDVEEDVSPTSDAAAAVTLCERRQRSRTDAIDPDGRVSPDPAVSRPHPGV